MLLANFIKLSDEVRVFMAGKEASDDADKGKSQRHAHSSFSLGIRGFPGQIYIMVVMGFIIAFGRSMAFPFLTMYLDSGLASGSLHIPTYLIGLYGVVGILSYMLALPLAGSLCDRIGRRKMMAIFLIPQAIMVPVYAYASTINEFLLLAASFNALGAFYDPSFSAMVADLVKPVKREEVYGLIYMVNNVATVISPPIGGIISDQNGYPILFIYATFFVAIGAAIFSLFIKESHPKDDKDQCRPEEANNQGESRFRDVFRDKVFIIFGFTSLFTLFVYSRMNDLLPIYMANIGYNDFAWSLVLSLNGGMVVALQILIRKGTVKIGPTKSFILAQLLITAGFSSILFAANFYQLLLSDVIFTLGEITFFPASSGFVANLAPPEMRGRYMSTINLFQGIGNAVGEYAILAYYGAYFGHAPKMFTFNIIWGFLGLIGIATLPGYLLLSRAFRRRRKAN
jgi:MFS family permease